MSNEVNMQGTEQDIQSIQQVLNGLVEAWNAANGSAYGSYFTADADYIDVTGNRTQGGFAIGKTHDFLFQGPLKGSKLEGGWGQAPAIQFLAPTVALVISGGTTKLEGQEVASADRASINTTILMKQGDVWKVRAFQNNRVMPLPAFSKKPE